MGKNDDKFIQTELIVKETEKLTAEVEEDKKQPDKPLKELIKDNE